MKCQKLHNLRSEAESSTTYWKNALEVNLKYTLLFQHQDVRQCRAQFPADLVTFTEEILDGKLHFLYIDMCEIVVSLFRILWIPIQLLLQIDDEDGETSTY